MARRVSHRDHATARSGPTLTMAIAEDSLLVQAVVEINSRTIYLLVLALTAAGADEKYDGNRKMAGKVVLRYSK